MADDVILSFRNVSYASGSHLVAEVVDASLEARRGELILVRPDPRAEKVPLFELAEGLLTPDAGEVAFLGADWRALTTYDASALRGRIGRTFAEGGWVSNLDVLENIVLAQRHHTLRAESELAGEAEERARMAGFSTVPAGRPHLLRKGESRRAQWVRAFMGRPDLVLLEGAEVDVLRDEELPWLAVLVKQALANGAAVVWSTGDAALWNNPADLKPARRYAFGGGRLTETAEGR